MRTCLGKQVIVTLLIALVLTPAATVAQGKVTLSVDRVDDSAFPAVQAVVTVASPNGVPILGLAAGKFELSEDGKPVSVSELTSAANPDVKVTVALAIDASGSMVGSPFQEARKAAVDFLGKLMPLDEAAIIVFAEKVDLGEPFPKLDPQMEHDFDSDKGELTNLLTLADAVQGARTPLYDSLFKAIRMTVRQPVGRRAVILFTDGNEKEEDETASVLKPDDPIAEATKYGIPVFTIGLGPDADTEYLQRVALMTGGTYASAAQAGELGQLFLDVVNVLKQQYTLEWTSNTPADCATHQGVVRAKTSMGDGEAALSFRACPLGCWVRQLKVRKATQPLEDGGTVRGVVVIEPEVYCRNTTARVEFYVDGKLVGTSLAAPFAFNWNTRQAGLGEHTLLVRAYDDATPPQTGDKAVQVTVQQVSIIEQVPRWVYAIILLALLAAVALLLTRRARRRVCPTCGRVMDPGWTECLFCASERSTGVRADAPAGEHLEAITGLERPAEAPGEAPSSAVERRVSPAETVSLRAEPQALAWLIVEQGERVGKEFRLHEGDTSIGRSSENDVIISDPAASRQQAKVKLEQKLFYIYDLGATNPTMVNNKAISRHRLEEGDRIQIGNTVLVFKRV